MKGVARVDFYINNIYVILGCGGVWWAGEDEAAFVCATATLQKYQVLVDLLARSSKLAKIYI